MLCAQTSSNFSTPAHKKAIKYLQLTESRAIQVVLGSHWSTAKWGVKEKVEWNFTCLKGSTRCDLCSETSDNGVVEGKAILIQFIQHFMLTCNLMI